MNNPYQIDVKLIQSFKPQDYQEIEQAFKSFDTNKNGTLEKQELVDLLHALGYRTVTQDDVRKFLDEADLDKDGVLSFYEFVMMMKRFVDKGETENYTRIVTKEGKGLIRLGSKETTESMAYQSFSEEERSAYTKVFNIALADDEICKKYSERDRKGLVHCFVKDNMKVFFQHENLNLAISAAKSIGYNVINIFPETFMEEKQVMILGILWQIVKNVVLGQINLKQFPELVRLLNEGEQLSDLLKLSQEELLLRWFNYHLREAGYDKRITNFSSDVKDSEKYTILLNQLKKDLCDKSALDETDLTKRAKKVVENAKKLGAEAYITPKDIVSGNQKLNTLFVASIFNACHGLSPATEQEKYDAAKLLDDDIEGAREERAFRMWINSLGIPDVYINNLYEESKSGVLLCKVIDKVKPGTVNWKIIDKNPKNPFKATVNCQEVIDASKKSKYTIVGIGAQDIREGNKKYILAIVWQIMRAHTLQVIGGKTEEELVSWGNERVSEEYRITNLKSKSLSNSLFFIDICKSIEPRAINWDIVMKDDTDEAKQNNAKYAISIARKLGAAVFLVWEDVVDVKSRLLLTFIAALYDAAQKYKPK